jgi:hypothetical protein
MQQALRAEDAEALIAVRTSWEGLQAEVHTHDGHTDVYLCLACHRAARQFCDAVEQLGRIGRAT